MDCDSLMARLKALANAENVTGMARFGINPHNTLGISVAVLRGIAKETGRDHALALRLWESGIHEARILATLVDVPGQVDEAQMERWALDVDSWDVCDQLCSNLFVRTPYSRTKALAWSAREETFVKRAGFVLMTQLAVKDRKADDAAFLVYLPVIAREAHDERHFVKKAISWALRQIGKRSPALNVAAIQTAQAIARQESKAARWVASDALRELQSEKAQSRLRSKQRAAHEAIPGD